MRSYNSRVLVIPEAKPRYNRKRESYNERITHTSIYQAYTIVTTEIAEKCGLCREKCGLCREKCGLCDYITHTYCIDQSDQLEVTYYGISIG